MAAPAPGGKMTLAEARSILGVDAEATDEEVKAAYTRLMRLAHPDKGGTSGLASQLNAARDRLLRK
jgi:curved DNA-binding protein CbpA